MRYRQLLAVQKKLNQRRNMFSNLNLNQLLSLRFQCDSLRRRRHIGEVMKNQPTYSCHLKYENEIFNHMKSGFYFRREMINSSLMASIFPGCRAEGSRSKATGSKSLQIKLFHVSSSREEHSGMGKGRCVPYKSHTADITLETDTWLESFVGKFIPGNEICAMWNGSLLSLYAFNGHRI